MKTATKKINKVSTKKVDNATTVKLSETFKGKKRETKTKEKNFLYNFQLNEKNLTEKDQKKRRNKIRRKLINLSNQLVLDNVNKKQLVYNNCKEFIKFYKDEFIVNDFNIKSLTNVSDEEKIKDYTFILNLCKESLAKK